MFIRVLLYCYLFMQNNQFMIKLRFFTSLLTSLWILSGGAGAFAAHIIVAPSVTYINGSSAPYNTLQPGDTLLFQAGPRSYIQVRNFNGNAAHPIFMMNTGVRFCLARTPVMASRSPTANMSGSREPAPQGLLTAFMCKKRTGTDAPSTRCRPISRWII